jgi:hypothetical protein
LEEASIFVGNKILEEYMISKEEFDFQRRIFFKKGFDF